MSDRTLPTPPAGTPAPADRRRARLGRPAKPQASVVRYKAALRKAIRKNAQDPEIDFLNITAMLDLMTIILVFLLKSMAASSASIPQSKDLTLPSLGDHHRGRRRRAWSSSSPRRRSSSATTPTRSSSCPSREQLAQSGVDSQLQAQRPERSVHRAARQRARPRARHRQGHPHGQGPRSPARPRPSSSPTRRRPTGSSSRCSSPPGRASSASTTSWCAAVRRRSSPRPPARVEASRAAAVAALPAFVRPSAPSARQSTANSSSRSALVSFLAPPCVLAEHARHELLLLALEQLDLLLDRAGRDEPVGGHDLGLADAVGAIGGLLLDGRVPPRIEVDDGVGGGEVEARAAGLEADEEDRARSGRSGSARRARRGPWWSRRGTRR